MIFFGDLEMDVDSPQKTTATPSPILIGANARLTLKDIKKISTTSNVFSLNKEAQGAMEKSYLFLQSLAEKRKLIYGVNTNFGDQGVFLPQHLHLTDRAKYYQSITTRQEQIIKSLACSVGNSVPIPIVKLTMLLRAHCLAQGYSGVSFNAVNALLNFLNKGITPIVQQYGSIGASGDLIPLSMIAAALIGENVEVYYQGQVMKAPQAIRLAGLEKFIPELRDGLALINGTSFMTAIASLSLCHLQRLFNQMLIAIAMALEAMQVNKDAYEPCVHALKYHRGQNKVNAFFVDFWQQSQLISCVDQSSSHRSSRPVQDYYSLRSVPQGFGPFQENIAQAIIWIEDEINAVDDNPIIDVNRQEIYHCANFMGYYVTDACDILKMNIAQASTWVHALLANMVHPRKNNGLPANLVENPEVNNGFRAMQLLAAALAVQNRKFAQAQQAFMLPTEGDNQDINSLGTHAALDFREAVINLERLTVILLLAATQALELRGIEKASKKSQVIYAIIRSQVPKLVECHPMAEEINKIVSLLQSEEI